MKRSFRFAYEEIDAKLAYIQPVTWDVYVESYVWNGDGLHASMFLCYYYRTIVWV
jgi:hypothetical protein